VEPKKQYPEWTDFPVEQTLYGVHAPFCGIGIYTLNRKFSWPDMEGCSEQELKDWRDWLEVQGYEVPKKYLGKTSRET
jgi:hypothetical protein